MVISMFLTINSYRSRDEIQSVRKTQDPIASLKERLLAADLATADDIKVGLGWVELNRIRDVKEWELGGGVVYWLKKREYLELCKQSGAGYIPSN